MVGPKYHLTSGRRYSMLYSFLFFITVLLNSLLSQYRLFRNLFNLLITTPQGWSGLGGLYLEELIHGGAYFRNFMVHFYRKCEL